MKLKLSRVEQVVEYMQAKYPEWNISASENEDGSIEVRIDYKVWLSGIMKLDGKYIETDYLNIWLDENGDGERIHSDTSFDMLKEEVQTLLKRKVIPKPESIAVAKAIDNFDY